MGGRVPSRCAAVDACGDESGGKIGRRLFEDLIGLTQLPVLALKFFDAVPLGRGHAVAFAGIRLMLFDPDAQAVPAASNLLRDR